MKLNVGVPAVKDSEGNDIDLTARPTGNRNAFALVEPGVYVAHLKGVELSTKEGKYKDKKPPKGSKGWTYAKITPDIELVNDAGTVINRQELTIGVIKDGALYRPDEDGKSAMWPESQYFLNSIGLLNKNEDGTYALDFDDRSIKSRMLKVGVGVGGYIKGSKNFAPNDLYAFLKSEVNGGEDFDRTLDNITEAAYNYNSDNGLIKVDGTLDDTALKLKNHITAFFPLGQSEAEDAEYYVDYDSQVVYLSEADYIRYLDFLANPPPEDSEEDYEEAF